MKILHVIPSLSLAHGGPSHAMRLIERALRMQEVEVETATTDDDGPGKRMPGGCCKEQLFVRPSQNPPLPQPSPARGEGVVRRYFPKRLEFYKVSPGFARWIFRHVRDYDLVHIHALFSFTSVIAAWAARRAGVPYVVRPLGTLNRYGVKQQRPWLKRLSLRAIEGPILRHAAAVHFTAEAERVEAESLGIPMRSVVIPLGIEPAPQGDASVFLVRFPEVKNFRILLFLSRLDPKKNVEGLLQAFKLCSSALPDTRLVIAGTGEAGYVAGLIKLADTLGLADRVVWPGYVDGEQKAAAFAAAQVFVLPSHSENFGIAAVEAMLAGLPCVLGEGVALANEVAQAGAGLATSPQPEEIAMALQVMLADDNRRAEMGRRAAALARERYSLEAMGAGLVRLYESIVNSER
jgi:glycosyltransferase involved in cell wall biosynthesis